jgi:RNA polymerase sigma factor (TIGR02999 family)
LLVAWAKGDREAGEALMPLVYDELRRIARRCLRGQFPNQTINSGTLVHEAYFKLVGQKSVEWQNRAHFFGVAVQMMRRILVDDARRRQATKRGAGERGLSLDVSAVRPRKKPVQLIALDAALNDLARLDPRQARVVELRFFGGLSIEETAEFTGMSPATVKREWMVAKAWLHRELQRGEQA